MRFGSLHGSGFGSPDNQVAVFEPVLDSNGFLNVKAQAATGFGDAYFGLYANTKRLGVMYLVEGSPSFGKFRLPSGNNSLALLRHGQLGEYVMDRPARSYEATNAKRATLSWIWTPEILGTPDTSWLTNWALSSVLPSLTTTGSLTTRCSMNVVVTKDGSSVTVSLDNGGDVLATGTGTANSTITLTGTLTGSVDVGALPVATVDSLLFRFPSKMEVLRGTVNPPTVAVATVLFSNHDDVRWTEPADLASGTYYYRIRPVSDTGQTGTSGAVSTVIIPGPPAAPTNLHYDSGDASATVIHWTKSTTAGSTYRIYLQQPGDKFMDLNVYTTAIANAQSATLPAVTGYPGTARVLVRALNGSTEEKNLAVLDIEYATAGTYVYPRPNAPAFGATVVTAGLTVTVQGVYSVYGEKGTPTKLQLFSRTPTGSYDFATADTEGTLGAVNTGIRLATLSKTYLTAGWRYLTLKASKADGTQSDGYAVEYLVYVSDAASAAPTMTAEVSRG